MWWPGGSTWMPFGVTSTNMPAHLVPFNQICPLVQWKSKRKATQSMPLHQTCQLKLWNFSRQDYCYVVSATYMLLFQWDFMAMSLQLQQIYVFWPCVTSTKIAAVQTCLLVECFCKMGACWTIATQSVWLPIFYHSILHACWCCASLSAIPTFMVFHYQLCLLVWCLTI